MKNLLLLLFLAVSVCGQGVSSDAPFFGNSSTNLYFPKECAEAARIPAAYRAAFYSQKAAEEKGFRLSEKCTRAKPSFESMPNVPSVLGKPGSVVSEKPVRKITGRRIKNLAEIDRNLAAFLNQVVVISASVKVGGYYGKYLNMEESMNPFEIYDGTMSASASVYVYMPRGELSEDLCRRITTAKDETLAGTFTFQITGETFWQRGGDRFGLLGDLIDYEIEPENK